MAKDLSLLAKSLHSVVGLLTIAVGSDLAEDSLSIRALGAFLGVTSVSLRISFRAMSSVGTESSPESPELVLKKGAAPWQRLSFWTRSVNR